jgi:transcriptional regulator with XRE-family HTH domain
MEKRPGPALSVPMQREFGQRLREARIAAGLTQQELASRIGMQPSHLSEIESGQQNVTMRSMAALAHALGLQLQVLLAPAPRKKS